MEETRNRPVNHGHRAQNIVDRFRQGNLTSGQTAALAAKINYLPAKLQIWVQNELIAIRDGVPA